MARIKPINRSEMHWGFLKSWCNSNMEGGQCGQLDACGAPCVCVGVCVCVCAVEHGEWKKRVWTVERKGHRGLGGGQQTTGRNLDKRVGWLARGDIILNLNNPPGWKVIGCSHRKKSSSRYSLFTPFNFGMAGCLVNAPFKDFYEAQIFEEEMNLLEIFLCHCPHVQFRENLC